MSARAALSSRSSPSLLVALLLPLLSFPAFAQLSNKRSLVVEQFPRAGADGPAGATPLGLVGVSSWRPWWAGAPLLEPAHDRTVGRVHCPKWSLDLFLLQGLPSETRWLPGQRPVGGAKPELVRYHLFFGLWDVRLSKVHVAGVLRLKRLLTYISPIDIGLQGSASPVTNGCAASVSRCPLV